MFIANAIAIGENNINVGYSTELQSWVDAGTLAGNTLPSASILSALDTFLGTALETGTVISRMKTGYIFHAGSKEMAKLNLKNPSTFALTEVGTVTFSEGNGCKSASSSYFSQPFKSDQYSGIESDLTCIQYVSESSAMFGSNRPSGFRTDVATGGGFYMRTLIDASTGWFWGFSATKITFSNTDHKGLYVMLNNGSLSIVYKNGVKSSLAITPSAPLTSQNRLILAGNNNTGSGITPIDFYPYYVSLDFLFDRFSDADELAFRTAFNTYKTAVGLP